MPEITVYLRCQKDHANSVSLRDRHDRVGSPCSVCGAPLMAAPDRERPPFRGRF